MAHTCPLSVENEVIVQNCHWSLVGFSMEWTRRTCLHIWVVVPLNAKGLSGHLLHTAHLLWDSSSSLSLKYFQISDLHLDGTYVLVFCGKLIDSLLGTPGILNGVNASHVVPQSCSCTGKGKSLVWTLGAHSPSLVAFIVFLELKILPDIRLGSQRYI